MPREPFQWGESFVTLLPALKAPKIKLIQEKRREYLEEAAALRAAAGVYRAKAYHFSIPGFRCELAYVEAKGAWVLEIAQMPAVKKRRTAKKSGAAKKRVAARRQVRKRTLKGDKASEVGVKKTSTGQPQAVMRAAAANAPPPRRTSTGEKRRRDKPSG